jgi:CheY-like chemotaxis protein
MSWLLVVQPDSVQADALRQALRAHVSEDIVVAESLDDALALIEQAVPDVILLPTLMPAAVEDYLVTYLGTIPGASHVQILGLPRLERSDNSPRRRTRSLLPWRRRQEPRADSAPGCDPWTFAQDVIAYLAGARALKEEIELYGAHRLMSGGQDRRREPRFARREVPWISVVRFGGQRAALVDVSARGVRLRTHSRPEHGYLRRSDPNVLRRSRLTIELESHRELHAIGRVIRCIPLRTHALRQYEIVFSFNDAVGLHLPEAGALVSAHSSADHDELSALRAREPWAPTLTRPAANYF